MAFYDNLTEDQKQRMLLGLGARIWASSLQQPKAGVALAGGILGALDDYSQITAESRRATLEQQQIDRNDAMLDRMLEENRAKRELSASLQGEGRGLYSGGVPKSMQAPGDMAMPGQAYHGDIHAATTPEGIGGAIQRYGAQTGDVGTVLRGMQLPAQLEQAEREKAIPGYIQSIQHAARTGDRRGLAAGMGELAQITNNPQTALTAGQILNPARDEIATVGGHQVLRRTNPVTGEVTLERVPWSDRPADPMADLLANPGKKQSETPPAAAEAPKAGWLDRAITGAKGLASGISTGPSWEPGDTQRIAAQAEATFAQSRYKMSLDKAQTAYATNKPISAVEVDRLLADAKATGDLESRYAQDLIRQLREKGLVK